MIYKLVRQNSKKDIKWTKDKTTSANMTNCNKKMIPLHRNLLRVVIIVTNNHSTRASSFRTCSRQLINQREMAK